jgi:predicted nucleic acid-binding protein
MKDKFVDTNLLVYLLADDERADKLHELFSSAFNDIILSTQILGELYSVLTRKKLKTHREAKLIIEELIFNFEVLPVRDSNVISALNISEEYGFSYWDSLVVATAIDAGCKFLYTEDLQHGQVIGGKLKVTNPFKT